MANFDNSAHMGKQLIFKLLKERMQSRNISQRGLEELTAIPQSTIARNLSCETEMTLDNFLKILGALEIRPYFIHAEDDDTEMQRMHFS